MKKICFIIPYFGRKPPWMDYFLKSCEFNPKINWLIFTEKQREKDYPENVGVLDFSLADFNELATQKLGFKVRAQDPYKLCDFKPAYGVIFQDYLKSYDFWGHTDMDVVYGDIKRHVTDEMLSNYDVVSSKDVVAGHFTLYKNTRKINSLFKHHPGHKFILQHHLHMAFDEQFNQNADRQPEEIKKKHLQIEGMNALVKEKQALGCLDAKFRLPFKDVLDPRRPFSLRFNEGGLEDEETGENLLYVHLKALKKPYRIFLPKQAGNSFSLTHLGVVDEDKAGSPRLKLELFKRHLIESIQDAAYAIDRRLGVLGEKTRKLSKTIYES